MVIWCIGLEESFIDTGNAVNHGGGKAIVQACCVGSPGIAGLGDNGGRLLCEAECVRDDNSLLDGYLVSKLFVNTQNAVGKKPSWGVFGFHAADCYGTLAPKSPASGTNGHCVKTACRPLYEVKCVEGTAIILAKMVQKN